MTDQPVWMVYLTAANEREAGVIARALVEEGAAACVNVMGSIKSVYRWEGNVTSGEEIALIAKTTMAQYPRLEKLVKQHHSYDVPCIVAWPLVAGYPPFLDWLRTNASETL